jgi:hypothetical protein
MALREFEVDHEVEAIPTGERTRHWEFSHGCQYRPTPPRFGNILAAFDR